MRVLFLTHRLPYAPNRGDRIRAYHLMHAMSRFAQVSLFSLVHDAEEAAETRSVRFAERVVTAMVPRVRNLVRGALALPTERPLTHALLDAPRVRQQLSDIVRENSPDVVLAYCSGMARFAMEPPLATLPFVLDMVDVDSRKWADLGQTSSVLRRWIYQREARTLRAFEIAASERAASVTVVTESERDELTAMARRATVHVVPNGVDLNHFAPIGPPSTDPVVVFSGMMDYAPNVDAVLSFAAGSWPTIKSARPDARFVVLGAQPTHAVRALADRDPSISVTGRVESIPPHLWKAAVAVAPLAVARGVQNKVLEALAAGVPAVVSEAVRRGLPDHVQRGCLVAEDPGSFAHDVLSLLAMTPERRRQMAISARVETLGWRDQLDPLESILRKAVRTI